MCFDKKAIPKQEETESPVTPISVLQQRHIKRLSSTENTPPRQYRTRDSLNDFEATLVNIDKMSSLSPLQYKRSCRVTKK